MQMSLMMEEEGAARTAAVGGHTRIELPSSVKSGGLPTSLVDAHMSSFNIEFLQRGRVEVKSYLFPPFSCDKADRCSEKLFNHQFSKPNRHSRNEFSMKSRPSYPLLYALFWQFRATNYTYSDCPEVSKAQVVLNIL